MQGVYPTFIVNKCTACEGGRLTLYPRYEIYEGYICTEFENNYDYFSVIMSSLQRDFLEQTSASVCEGFPRFWELTPPPPPPSGCEGDGFSSQDV
jgi:hypothetical protein